MIGYTMVGTRDLDRSLRFYDPLFSAMGWDTGGSEEGGPGFRPQYGEGFYGAYVRDPDGNKLAFVCYDAKPAE